MLISLEEYERLSKVVPPMIIELLKPRGKAHIILSWADKGTRYMPSSRLDAACQAIRSFVE